MTQVRARSEVHSSRTARPVRRRSEFGWQPSAVEELRRVSESLDALLAQSAAVRHRIASAMDDERERLRPARSNAATPAAGRPVDRKPEP